MFKQSFCHVTLAGRIGRDPVVRYTPSGVAVATFSVAVTETWKGGDGEKKERTDWHTIEVFGKTAEFCERYLSKGRMVLVAGKMHADTYEKDGAKRTLVKIVAESITTLEKRPEDPMRDLEPPPDPVDDSSDGELPF